jgi:RimJ/RimL family protein N-acetyltransferase
VLRPPAQPLGDGVVTLRLLRPEDRAAVLETMRDPLVRTWLNMPRHPRDADVDELLRTAERGRAQGTRFDLVVVDGDEPALGEVVLSQRHRDNWEVAYMAPERGRGRGLMARAVRLAADWLLDQGVGRIELRTHPENAASQRVAERAGFVREGVERRSIWLHGVRQDALVWSLLPEDRA